MCTITLITNGEPKQEVEAPTIQNAIYKAAQQAKATGKGYDAYDELGRVVAVVSPKKVDVMPWVLR